MIEKTQEGRSKVVTEGTPTVSSAFQERRATLKKLGRFAAVTAPTATLLLAASTKPAKAPCISCLSSRQLKTTGEGIEAGVILGGVAGLAVERWRYKPGTGLDHQTHIGPFAEDFQAAFGIGDGVTVSTIDAIGVSLAAIKALSAKVEGLEAELQASRRKKAA